MRTTLVVLLALLAGTLLAQQDGHVAHQAGKAIPFGSALDADRQILESQQLAKELSALPNPRRRAKGDQHRTYNFPAAKKQMPYRLYVLSAWDCQSSLPLIVMLHSAGSDENRYVDINNRQLIRLADQHGYAIASPLGYSPLGAYGTPLRLPAVFGQPEAAAKQRSAVTPEAEHTLELSEAMYAGAYAFGKTESRTKVINGRARKSEGHFKSRESWMVLIQNHHPGYISWEQFERNQAMLCRVEDGREH